MDDKIKGIVDQYPIEIKRVFRVRGAYLMDTEEGLCILREFRAGEAKAELAQKVKKHLVENGYQNVDIYLKNKEEKWITENTMGNAYVLKRWYQGMECDLQQPEHVMRAGKNLARLHLLMRNVTEEPLLFQADTYEENILRHNRELRRVRTYIREKKQRNEFELLFLSVFHEFYQEAEEAEGLLGQVDVKKLYGEMESEQALCHGSYNYHNLVFLEKEDATTNFEHVHMQLQCMDLYDFLRKVLEKNNWNMNLFQQLVDAYEQVRPLSKEEKKVLQIRLSMPEKFWKLANFYYNNKKTWISAKNVEKLQNLQYQKKQRRSMIEKLPALLAI